MSNTQNSTSSERSELQVRSLLGEIAQHAQRDIPPDEFHAEFLRRVVSALGAVGGGLWTLERGSLTLAYQINFKELKLQEGDNEKHARTLIRLLSSPDTGTLLPPHSSAEGENDISNPTENLLICCPIRTELEIVGIVEIIHRADAPVAVQQGFVQFVSQTCRLATDYYKNRQLRHFGERQNLWVVLEDFTRTIHQSLDPKLTAYTVANEGRRLIGCDRVSIALRQGKNCPIAAVSGQDTVNKRSTTVRLLGKLAASVLKAGEPLWYTGDTSDFPPQIERTIEKYVDESHSKMIAVYPLFHRKKEHEKEQLEKHRKKRLRPFGVMIAEQIGDSQLTEQTRKRTDIVAEHAGSALGNALEHQSIFLLPVWTTIGKSKQLVMGETLPKTLAVVACILTVLGILFFMPWDFTMNCDGKLEPVVRKRIYASIDGEIERLYVDDGDRVHGPLGPWVFHLNGVPATPSNYTITGYNSTTGEITITPLGLEIGKQYTLDLVEKGEPISTSNIVAASVTVPFGASQIAFETSLTEAILREGGEAVLSNMPALSGATASQIQKGLDGLRGTTLVKLRSADLESLEIELKGDEKEKTEQLVSIERRLQDPERKVPEHERAELVGRRDGIEIQLDTVRKKLDIFTHEQQPNLYITSPINGIVVSWDVKRRLEEKKPISRMQYVMEIADTDGDWQLELLMPEKRMGYITEQQQRNPDKPLRVEFRLASTPTVTYYGTVSEIHGRAEVRSEGGGAGAMATAMNTVSMKVAIDDCESIPPKDRLPGGGCIAKINCGTRPVGYVLFYEVIIYVQKNILFRWF